jgi:hypothetical protein
MVSGDRVCQTLCIVLAAGLLVAAGLMAARAAEPAAKSPAKAETPKPPPAWLKDIPYRIVYESYRDGNWEIVMVTPTAPAR